MDPVPHYFRTFEQLAPTEEVARPHRRRWRPWLVLPILAVLVLWARPSPRTETPAPEQIDRVGAPKIALAPVNPEPQSHEIVPPVRVVEQQGPKLIERMLAEKFGTPLPTMRAAPPRQPEPPPVVVAKPVAPPAITDRPALSERPVIAEKPPIIDRPQLAEKPAVAENPAKPVIVATAPRPAETVSQAPSASKKPQIAERAVPAEPRPARVEQAPVAVVRSRTAEPERVPVAVVEPERIAAVRAPAPAPARVSGPSHDAVRRLLDRYAAAWRGHDVDTLRAIGQVTSDGQANALRQYFANVGSLQVEVRVLDIRSEGDRATVRFTRRDRFHDPTGREIEKESPPIEKVVVVTPQGLRFAPTS